MRDTVRDEAKSTGKMVPWRASERSDTPQRLDSMSRHVIPAIIFIESSYRESFSLDRIAESACVSRFHLARMFRAATGMSPMEYVRWRRVMEAKRLLRCGRESLMSIATGLGYFDYSHFSRSFRSATGQRPTQYAAKSCEPG